MQHCVCVLELSLSSWLVAGIVPGVERQPLKKLKTDENALLTLLNRWRDDRQRDQLLLVPRARAD
jgi:transposase